MAQEINAIFLLLLIAFLFGYSIYIGWRYRWIAKRAKTLRQKIFIRGYLAGFALLILSLLIGTVMNSAVIFAYGITLLFIVIGVSLLYGAPDAPYKKTDKITKMTLDKSPNKHELIQWGICLLLIGSILLVVFPLSSMQNVSRDIPFIDQLSCGGPHGSLTIAQYDHCFDY